MNQAMQRVTVLGATGSIGLSTLDVLARHPERFEIYAVTAHTRWVELLTICQKYRPAFAVVDTPEHAWALQQQLAESGIPTHVLCGPEGLVEVASDVSVDTVMAAIVGAAGLAPTLAAVKAGKRVLLANKEALVM